MPSVLRYSFITLFLLTLSLSSYAQGDKDGVKPVKPKPDTITLHARRAALYSAVLPGMGQAYNKRYWKMPIIYAGLGVCTYFAVGNYKNYHEFNRLADSVGPTDVNYQYYAYERDYYRHNFEMSMLIGLGIYTLQIVDAYVDAHLKEFDVSPELSLSISPLLYTNYNAELVTGIRLKFKFRHENRIDWLRQNGQSY